MFSKKAKVIIDTNFLLMPGQFNVDIFSEIDRVMDKSYEICIIDSTMEELNKLIVLGKKKDREAAKLGYVLVESLKKQKSLKTIAGSSNKNVDDIIVAKANKNVYVATNDKELKQRVKEKEGKIITLRQKKYLVRE